MPVRTHERHRASGGGLTWSDGSWRALLAARDKARRRSVKLWEHRGDGLRLSDRDARTDKASHGTERGTEIAFVGSTGLVVGAAVGVAMAGAVVLRGHLVVLVLVPGRGGIMAVRVFGQLSFSLHPETGSRAQHPGRKCAAQRQQHGEEQQKPKAESLHSS